MPHTRFSVRSSAIALLVLTLVTSGLFVFAAYTASAQEENGTGGTGLGNGTGGTGLGNGTGGTGSAGTGGTNATQLMNPLKSETLTGFLLNLIDILILFAIPLIILMIIYAGFLYVMARGNEEQVTRATRALTYAVIGGLLILGAKLLLTIIQGTVDQLVR
jgi:hypothetical protein